MFYSQFILAKKGPLGTIWIAAHLERKLRKNQVAETDIGVTVDNILFPEVPIALRLSGHLLLGVVRIYSRQVNYLFNDCSETLGKIKQAFHSAAVDLPPEATTAPFHTITLPETFDFDELELGPDPENAFLYSKGKFVDHHVTTREQITLQDSIQNNPYLGSSQFGLDERFGDGSYSSLGLDFDEEFWGSKAGPSSVASTSTPLLKEDTVVLPAGGENEVTHMDVDDPYGQPLESDIQRSMAIREAVHTDARQVEMDNQLNTSFPASSSTQFNEPHGLETASRKVSDFAALKNDTPSFHAYTPRVLEACTPDLNREYRPPDEPSTPALVDETSLPMYKECTAKTAGSVSPATLGITEKSSSGLLPASSSPQQVSGVSTLVSSSQAARSPSPASFQGLPVHQAAPAVTNREAFVTQKEKGPFLAVEENASSVPAPLQSVPEISLLQQKSTPVSHEGAVFPTGTSSFLTTPESSLSSLRQQDGNLSITANHQLAGIVHPELYPRFQNEGLAGDSQNLVSSSAAMMELAGTVNHELGERLQQQGLAVGSQNLVSSFGAMIGSAGKINDGVHESSPQQGLASGSPNSASLLGAKAGLAGTQGMYPSFQQQGLAVGSQNPMSSLPSSGAMAGTAGTVDHGGHASLQRELAVSSPNQVSLSGAMAGSVGAVNQRSYPSFQQQGLAVASPNLVSSSPLSGAAGSAGTVDHGVHVSSQQQGFAVASPNPASSWPLSGVAGLAGTVDHGVRLSSQQQGFAVASPNAASSLPSSGAVGSTGTVDHGARVSSQQQGFAVASPNPASSLPSSGAVKSTGTVDHGAHVSSQQQGTAIALPNPVSSLPSSGAMGLAGTVEHGVYRTSQHQGLAVASPDHQGLAVASPNPVSLLPSLGGTGLAGTVDHGVHVSSRQQVPGVGLSNQVHMSSRQQVPGVGSSNQVSFFGAMAGSAGTEKQGTHPSSQQQGLAIASPSPVPPLASATIGQAGTADHGVHDSSQQQGLAVGSLNPVSSFKAVAGLAGTGSYPSFQQQHLAVTSLPVSSLSSAMSTPAGITDREVNSSPQREGTVAGSPNPVPSSGAIAGTKSQGTHPSFQEQGLAVASANSMASVSSLGAMAGPAGAADHGVYKSSQQKELAVSSPSPTSLFGEMAVLSGTGSQEGHPTSQQQGLAAASLNAVSSSSSFGAMIGSTGSLNHGAHASSQQQGLAVGSPNAAPSFGAIAGSAGTRIQGTQSNFQQQGPAAASLNASLSSLGDMVGLPGTGNHGVHASSQKQGLAVGSPNPVSSFGAMAGSAGTGSRGIYPSFQQQGPAAASPNPMSSSAYGAMLGSAGSVSHGLQAFSHQQGFAAGSQTPVSSFGAMARSIGTANQEAYSSFQQQGPAFGPQNPVASFGAVVDFAVSPSPSTMRSMGANKMLASPFMTGASNAPLFSPNSGSILPVTNTLPTGQMSTKANKETMHETMDSAGFKDPVRSSVTQQVSLPSPTVRPGILPSMRLGERETLRSAYDLQSGGPGYLMMQKDLSVERIPSLEMERNRSFNVSTGGFTKEASLPAMDKIPLWREGTPQSLPREPFFPTQNISSHPADDDVLASILGRRNRDFKVLETPKDPKEPKVNAAKRPKRPPRITPKKRKIEIDTVAVLHGDVIRQQLANAEDIRRDRRKAPCTRREVWAFLRECEGQENFDEPTLPELSQNLHDLYHDVLHGRESRPSSSAPNGAMNANQPSESHLIRGGLTDSPVLGVNKQANMLGPRSESNCEVDRTSEDFNRDILIDKSEGYKNNSSENLAEPLNADAKVELIQTNAYVSSMEAENPENPSAKEFYKPEAGSERLAGKERDGIAPPEVQALEVYNPSSLVSRETEVNEQAKQSLSLDREDEASDPQREVPAISLSENVVGVIGADEGIAMTMPKEVLGIVGGDVGTQELVMTMPKVVFGAVGGDVVTQERFLTMTMQKDVFGVVGGDVGTQERALTVQHDTERVEEKQLLSFGVPEHEVASLGMETDFKPLDIPSDGKDLTEVPRSDGKDVLEVPLLNVVDPGRGIMEGQIEVPMLDGKDAPEMPPFYVVDIEKGKLEGRTEVPMSDGKDAPEMPRFYAVDIEKGNLEGRTEVPMSDANDVSRMPLFNVVDVERGNMEARTEVPMPDGKHVSEVPLLNIVDIEKGNMEVKSEVPMSDGKHISEVPLLNVVDVGNGNMEGRAEVPMSDGKDVSGLPLPNMVDMDKGNMEAGDKLLNADKGSMEGFSNLPTSNVTEGETNCRKDDEDIAAMECDRDADYADDHDDDNDIAFAEIDYSSDEQDASIQDSNGWSARSRNVGRYLKMAFGEMEGNLKRSEQPTLALERLLARKTKREAARMFFETLVLKTKDYIHVEQNVAYQEIHLFPRSKLMKTEF